MRRNTTLLILFVTAMMVSTGVVWGQLKRGVEPVVVTVNVRDADGKLVTGLKKEDFRVIEDGVSQSISNLSIDPVPLSAAIVVDDGMGGDALRRHVPLLEVMTSGFAPEDEMVSFRYDHFIWKLSDFTSDPKVIEKSFRELSKIAETRPAEGAPGDGLATGPSWLTKILGQSSIGTNGAPVLVPTAADRPKSPATSRVLHNALFEAATALKARPDSRRKIILLVSDGQVSGAGNTQTLDKNVAFLLENNIQVYSVATDYALREGALGLLSVYGKATGGDVYSGGSAREMETAFSRITEQARNQYVLEYISSNEPRGLQPVMRELRVETRTPGQTVTHRKSYIQYPAR